jgi:hypothetical protein
MFCIQHFPFLHTDKSTDEGKNVTGGATTVVTKISEQALWSGAVMWLAGLVRTVSND